MTLTTKTAGAVAAPATKEGDMVKIKILKGTVCEGRTVKPGDVIEASEAHARYLLATRHAEPFVGSEKKPAARKPKITTRKKAVKKND